MSFTSIHPIHFRNLGDETLDLSSSEVFFIGENGQGKTNFLEAVYFLCYASSFRVHRDEPMIHYGSSDMAVHGTFVQNSFDGGVTRKISTKYEKKKKSVLLDGKKLKDRKELVYELPCIVFSHDDMELVRGNPEYRRRFLNQTVSLYDPLSIDELRSYSKILRMRNEAVKNGSSAILDVLNIQLAAAGLVIQNRRNLVIREFNETFIPLFQEVSGLPHKLVLEYRPSWKTVNSEEAVIDYLVAHSQRDRIMKTTTSGPHRDRIVFKMEGRDFSSSASTGQIRLISLILKIAQSIYFTKKTGRKAVFLLDDVLLELDLEKRKSILKLLPPYEQAFFTFLPDEPFREYAKSDTLLYSVHDGRANPL